MREVSDIMVRSLTIRGWRCECGNVHANPEDLDLTIRYYDTKGMACGTTLGDAEKKRDNITVTSIEWKKDLEFAVTFDIESLGELTMDEPPPQGMGKGPNPTRLLSAAVGYCLTGNLLFCLQKSGIEVSDLKTIVSASVARNPEGRWRVSEIVVKISPSLASEDRKKLEDCINRFRDFSVVGQSVSDGIDVKVVVNETVEK